MNQSLYHISAEQKYLNALLEESEGEMTPELEKALAINEENFLAKTQSYIYAIKDYEAWEERIANEIARLQRVKRVAGNAKDRLKHTLIVAMQTFDTGKINIDTHTVSLRSTTAVRITDEKLLPREFFKVEVVADKKKLKEALKSGPVAGAELAEGVYLNIR